LAIALAATRRRAIVVKSPPPHWYQRTCCQVEVVVLRPGRQQRRRTKAVDSQHSIARIWCYWRIRHRGPRTRVPASGRCAQGWSNSRREWLINEPRAIRRWVALIGRCGMQAAEDYEAVMASAVETDSRMDAALPAPKRGKREKLIPAAWVSELRSPQEISARWSRSRMDRSWLCLRVCGEVRR